MALTPTSGNKVSYTSKDYKSILTDLVNAIPALTDKWKNYTEDDPGIVLIKLASYVGDMLCYNMDYQVLETFPQTATQRKNAAKLYELIGYKMHWYQSATCQVSVTLTKPSGLESSTVSLTLPKYAEIKSPGGLYYSIVGTDIDRTLLIPASASSVTVVMNAVQGKAASQQNIYVTSIPSTGQFKIDSSSIAEDKATSASTIHTQLALYDQSGQVIDTWTLVPNLLSLSDSGRYYEIKIDSNDWPYVQLVSNYSDFISDPDTQMFGLNYIISDGAKGAVGANVGFVFTGSFTFTVGSTTYTTDSTILSIVGNTQSSSGSNPETVDVARNQAFKEAMTLNTAVTLSDYEVLTETVEGVRACKALDSLTYTSLSGTAQSPEIFYSWPAIQVQFNSLVTDIQTLKEGSLKLIVEEGSYEALNTSSVVTGYYYSTSFYGVEVASANLSTTTLYVHVNNAAYLWSSATNFRPLGTTSFVQGYYVSGSDTFFSDSAHTQPITPNTSTAYADITTPGSSIGYTYSGSAYVATETTATVQGYIDISSNKLYTASAGSTSVLYRDITSGLYYNYLSASSTYESRGLNQSITGYYSSGVFYSDSAHTQEMTANPLLLYLDISLGANSPAGYIYSAYVFEDSTLPEISVAPPGSSLAVSFYSIDYLQGTITLDFGLTGYPFFPYDAMDYVYGYYNEDDQLFYSTATFDVGTEITGNADKCYFDIPSTLVYVYASSAFSEYEDTNTYSLVWGSSLRSNYVMLEIVTDNYRYITDSLRVLMDTVLDERRIPFVEHTYSLAPLTCIPYNLIVYTAEPYNAVSGASVLADYIQGVMDSTLYDFYNSSERAFGETINYGQTVQMLQQADSKITLVDILAPLGNVYIGTNNYPRLGPVWSSIDGDPSLTWFLANIFGSSNAAKSNYTSIWTSILGENYATFLASNSSLLDIQSNITLPQTCLVTNTGSPSASGSITLGVSWWCSRDDLVVTSGANAGVINFNLVSEDTSATLFFALKYNTATLGFTEPIEIIIKEP